MIEIGVMNRLKIDRFAQPGAYLTDNTDAKSVLLPKKHVPEGAKEGDFLDVFIYRDSSDRLIATTKKPKAMVGQLAQLKVVETTKIGAFLDWGLDKDILLPFSEQKYIIQKGKSYVVLIYLDKSKRISATTDIYDYLMTDSPYEAGDWVEGTVYGSKEGMGVFVAVDNAFKGMIPESECFENLQPGDRVKARVIRVREDGKLDLSTRKEAYKQMGDDSEKLMEYIKGCGGEIFIGDKSDPEIVKKYLSMSKAAFKRAAGKLLKEGSIEKTDKGYKFKNAGGRKYE
ncbi:S1 RNA binding domain [Peptoclostridium acidaminophilum DSM 3953]|uniref:S1 RNA binding domain n=2 Tax=Peptoclostridium acidaminophilum TaxID=1731 RepID=W8TEK3_PEPAC|nr:S1 RNA binding domain [Peptoclostridium acidaminophilum DSM 3953]